MRRRGVRVLSAPSVAWGRGHHGGGDPPKTPTAVGYGGAAATVDTLATNAAIDTLRKGGNAVTRPSRRQACSAS